MSPSRVPEGQQRGFIVPIGGAEDKVGAETILKRFVKVCGRREARIAVIPTASELRTTGRRYEELFRDLKVGKVWVLPFESRAQCDDEEELAVLVLGHRSCTCFLPAHAATLPPTQYYPWRSTNFHDSTNSEKALSTS